MVLMQSDSHEKVVHCMLSALRIHLQLFPGVRAHQMDGKAVTQTAGQAAHCKELCSPQQHRREPVPQRERPNLQCMARELSSMASVTGRP